MRRGERARLRLSSCAAASAARPREACASSRTRAHAVGCELSRRTRQLYSKPTRERGRHCRAQPEQERLPPHATTGDAMWQLSSRTCRCTTLALRHTRCTVGNGAAFCILSGTAARRARCHAHKSACAITHPLPRIGSGVHPRPEIAIKRPAHRVARREARQAGCVRSRPSRCPIRSRWASFPPAVPAR